MALALVLQNACLHSCISHYIYAVVLLFSLGRSCLSWQGRLTESGYRVHERLYKSHISADAAVWVLCW